MKISIVTISYNQASFLEKAIQSVIEQDYKDIEYIVVDPGSTDGSRDIIDKYRTRISRIIYEPDDGPADGLNKGFSYANGDIYGFLNSDDILLPGAFRYIVEYFISHPDVDIVSGHSVIIDEFNKELRKSYSERFSLIKHAYGAVVLMQPSTFFRSEIYRNTNGFNIFNKSNWDGEMFVDMAKKGAQFALINKILSGYRLHPGSITSSGKLDDRIKAYQKYIFRKIMGREWMKMDILLGTMLRVTKHLTSPRALYERITKGRIYMRHAKQIKDM